MSGVSAYCMDCGRYSGWHADESALRQSGWLLRLIRQRDKWTIRCPICRATENPNEKEGE